MSGEGGRHFGSLLGPPGDRQLAQWSPGRLVKWCLNTEESHRELDSRFQEKTRFPPGRRNRDGWLSGE